MYTRKWTVSNFTPFYFSLALMGPKMNRDGCKWPQNNFLLDFDPQIVFLSTMINWELISLNLTSAIWRKSANFWKYFSFCFFIIKSLRMKSGQHTLPIWKGVSVLNMHISIQNKYLWNWGCNAKEYECKFFWIRLY